MYILSKGKFSIYFGDASDKFYPPDKSENGFVDENIFSSLEKRLNAKHLIFLHQIHSSEGINISSIKEINDLKPFEKEGDFLITNLSRVAIGVLTADCLPIIIYDKKTNVVAIVHAGWQGSVALIALKAIEKMQQFYGTNIKNLDIFFGPSAKACCYEVSKNFVDNISCFDFIDQVIENRKQKIFFNLPKFNELLLSSVRVDPEQINQSHNLCTICNRDFYSYRRQGAAAGRNITVVILY